MPRLRESFTYCAIPKSPTAEIIMPISRMGFDPNLSMSMPPTMAATSSDTESGVRMLLLSSTFMCRTICANEGTYIMAQPRLTLDSSAATLSESTLPLAIVGMSSMGSGTRFS